MVLDCVLDNTGLLHGNPQLTHIVTGNVSSATGLLHGNLQLTHIIRGNVSSASCLLHGNPQLTHIVTGDLSSATGQFCVAVAASHTQTTQLCVQSENINTHTYRYAC